MQVDHVALHGLLLSRVDPQQTSAVLSDHNFYSTYFSHQTPDALERRRGATCESNKLSR